MGQTWYSDIYEPGTSYSITMQNMETNFASLRTMFSGPNDPGILLGDTVPGMPWFDSSKLLLKISNKDNAYWLGVFCGSQNHRMYILRNDAIDGWVVYPIATDRVLAIKGGAYTVGGTLVGDWDVSGLTYPHLHALTSHNHTMTGGSHFHCITNITSGGWEYYATPAYERLNTVSSHSHTVGSNADNVTESSPTVTGNTYRPAAFVFTMQYIDL